MQFKLCLVITRLPLFLITAGPSERKTLPSGFKSVALPSCQQVNHSERGSPPNPPHTGAREQEMGGVSINTV